MVHKDEPTVVQARRYLNTLNRLATKARRDGIYIVALVGDIGVLTPDDLETGSPGIVTNVSHYLTAGAAKTLEVWCAAKIHQAFFQGDDDDDDGDTPVEPEPDPPLKGTAQC